MITVKHNGITLLFDRVEGFLCITATDSNNNSIRIHGKEGQKECESLMKVLDGMLQGAGWSFMQRSSAIIGSTTILAGMHIESKEESGEYPIASTGN